MIAPQSEHDESPRPAPARPDTAAVRDRHFQELVAAVGDGPGVLPPEVRRALVAGDAPPGDWAGFAAEVADGGLAVSDADVAALAAAHGEDAVFECVVAVAIAAAGARLRTVEALLAVFP
jgi:hypothetical protein